MRLSFFAWLVVVTFVTTAAIAAMATLHARIEREPTPRARVLDRSETAGSGCFDRREDPCGTNRFRIER
jgi:hypothetical protein